MTQNTEKTEEPDTRILPKSVAASPVSREIACSSVGKMLHDPQNLQKKSNMAAHS